MEENNEERKMSQQNKKSPRHEEKYELISFLPRTKAYAGTNEPLHRVQNHFSAMTVY